MAELIKMKDIPVSKKSFTIEFRIMTGDRRMSRTYREVVKYPAYKISDLQEIDAKTRADYENECIARTKSYCDSRGEEVFSWVILDKDNRKHR